MWAPLRNFSFLVYEKERENDQDTEMAWNYDDPRLRWKEKTEKPIINDLYC